MVAVNVTDEPRMLGLTSAVTAVVVAAITIQLTVAGAAAAKLRLPAASCAALAGTLAITVPAVVMPVISTL